MEKAKWVKFIDVGERMHADLIESYFKAHGITIELVQESYEKTTFGFGLGGVRILVPDFQLDEARNLYSATGWDFDITETDDDEHDEEGEE